MPPKYTHEEFLRVARLNPSITLLGKYTLMQKKIKFQCNICGAVGYKVAHDLKRGIGCKYCAKTQTSFAECFIRVALEVTGVRVLARDKSAIDSELDIYLPDYRLAVEPGAWNFHRDRLKKDLEKWRKCCDNNIDLQIIYDSFDPDDISMVEKYEFISTYEKCLSFGDGCSTLKKMVSELLSKLDIHHSFAENEWEAIEKKATILSRRETEEEFRKKLHAFRQDIELVSLSRNRSAKALFKCNNCEYKWNVEPSMVMRKDRPTGCPKCGGTQLKTHQEFVNGVKLILPQIEITGTYTTSDKNIGYKCLICGYEGQKQASRLLQGHGCKKCSAAAKKRSMMKPQEVFEAEVAQINPNIEILGQYNGDDEVISCRCLNCGNIYSPHAGDLLRGHGCPKCARKNNAAKRMKAVRCIDTEMEYPSLKAAQEATGINGTSIANVCNGKQHLAGNQKWEWINQKESNSKEME